MILELRIFAFWLCLLSFFYVVARLDHHFSQTNVYFKFYDSMIHTVYYTIKIFGFIILGFWIFIQFTNYFFKGEFIFINS
jgi:hypothetical protein